MTEMNLITVTLPILYICKISAGENTVLSGMPKDENFRHEALQGLFRVSLNAKCILPTGIKYSRVGQDPIKAKMLVSSLT